MFLNTPLHGQAHPAVGKREAEGRLLPACPEERGPNKSIWALEPSNSETRLDSMRRVHAVRDVPFVMHVDVYDVPIVRDGQSNYPLRDFAWTRLPFWL